MTRGPEPEHRVSMYSCWMFGDLGYATEVHGFHAHMIRWCSLHTFNLGAMVWASAGAFDILVTKARDSTCNLTPLSTRSDAV